MNEYPLSTVSSKKIKKSSHSLFQRSACQATAPAQVNKAEYCHILKGERVFIELYYQGRVMETAYNQWIEFMGGTLYKRLNPKATIFLTNSSNQQLQHILDRVKRICPSCTVVSILWLERCFQAKNRVPFEQFVLDVQSKTKSNENGRNNEQQDKIDMGALDEFLTNITEDIEVQFKDFFKNKRNYFQYVTKNNTIEEKKLMRAQQFDLGPNPNKKRDKQYDQHPNRRKERPQKPNQENRRRRTSFKRFQGRTNIEIVDQLQKRETKSLEKVQSSKKVENQSDNQDDKDNMDQNKQLIDPSPVKKEGLSFNTMMEKYLSMREDSHKSNHNYSKGNISSKKKIQESFKEGLECEAKTFDGQREFSKTSSRHMAATQKVEGPRPEKTPIYSFSKKYAYEAKGNLKPNIDLQSQLQQLGQKIQSHQFNHLIVVSDSKHLSAKIERINQERVDNKEIYLQNIYYHVYINYLLLAPPEHKAYFLFHPRRTLDRPLYFALICHNRHYPKLVSCKLVEEIEHHNKKVRNGIISESPPIQSLKFRYLKELKLEVNRDMLRAKKIVFLQSELPVDMLQLIVRELQGQWISQNEYLMGRKPDIVATNRSSLPDSAFLTICEQDLWKKVFPMQEDITLA